MNDIEVDISTDKCTNLCSIFVVIIVNNNLFDILN